jgi:HlyD family secretion protein
LASVLLAIAGDISAGAIIASSDLKDTQSKLSEVLPKLVATREQLEHSPVRAPATGQVVGLTVFTVDGVVAPG